MTSPSTARVRATRNPYPAVKRLMPSDGSIAGFVAAVAATQSRRIEVVAVELGSRSSSGFRVVGSDVDYLVHASTATPEQRDLTICRELAHLLLGHHPRTMMAEPPTSGQTRSLRSDPYEQRQQARAERLARRMVALSVARQHPRASARSHRFGRTRTTRA